MDLDDVAKVPKFVGSGLLIKAFMLLKTKFDLGSVVLPGLSTNGANTNIGVSGDCVSRCGI